MQATISNDQIDSHRVIADEMIRRFEVRNKLLDYKLDRWSIWPILRFTLYSHLDSLQAKKEIKSAPWSVDDRFRAAIHDARAAAVLPQSDIIALVQSSNRSENVGGKFKDIYFDDLLARTGSFVKVENLANLHYLPRSKTALIPSHLSTINLNLAIALMLRLPRPEACKVLASRLSQLIWDEFGLPAFTEERISTHIANFYWAKRIYKLLFQRIHAKYLLLTTAYRYHAPVAAAKELGVQVVELQHGLVDRYHNGYSWTEDALTQKRSLPIPDRLFLYGEYWENELSMRGFLGCRITPGWQRAHGQLPPDSAEPHERRNNHSGDYNPERGCPAFN